MMDAQSRCTAVRERAHLQQAVEDLKPESGQLSRLPPEDRQVVVSLLQRYPQLRQDFTNIIDFADLMNEDCENYEELFQSLTKLYKAFQYSLTDVRHICRFAAAAGFAELAVRLIRQVTNEMGQVYIASASPPHPNHKVGCVAVLSTMLLNLTDKGMDFRLPLAKTGVLQDMVQGLELLRHLPGEALDKGRVCFNSTGTLHNCCKHPEVLPTVREMNIFGHISPFLHKNSHIIRAAALLLLSFVVEDSDLHLLELDHRMLQYCVCRAEAAWTSLNRGKNGFETEELLAGLSNFARLPYNRRLIVAKGVLPLLTSVLQSGVDDERKAAADTLAELAKDPENVKVFKRDKTLRDTLEGMEKSESSQKLLPIVAELLTLIRDTDCDDNAALRDLLADQLNMLTIVEMGEVELVLDQLNISTARGTHVHGDVLSRVKVLQALRRLARDDSCRREIMSRGGLDLLQKVLQGGNDNEQLESAHLLLELISCREYSILLQARAGLMETVKGLTQQGGQLSSTATHIVNTVTRHAQ